MLQVKKILPFLLIYSSSCVACNEKLEYYFQGQNLRLQSLPSKAYKIEETCNQDALL
jgi:hypothetical protein